MRVVMSGQAIRLGYWVFRQASGQLALLPWAFPLPGLQTPRPHLRRWARRPGLVTWAGHWFAGFRFRSLTLVSLVGVMRVTRSSAFGTSQCLDRSRTGFYSLRTVSLHEVRRLPRSLIDNVSILGFALSGLRSEVRD